MLDVEGIILEFLEEGEHWGIGSLIKKCKKKGISAVDADNTIQNLIHTGVLLVDESGKVYT